MTSIIRGANVAEAWQGGSALISQTPGHVVRNLITEIDNPTYVAPDWYNRFDPKSVGAGDRMSVVAKVLFPDLPRRAGEARPAYYKRCESLLNRARRMGRLHSSWGGTYFQRLLSLNGSEWPAPGSEDTELGVLMEPEVRHGETTVYAGVQA